MANAAGYIADYLNGLSATEKLEVAASIASIGVDYPTLLSNYTWRELGMFIHFGLETFLNVEYNDGTAPINTFAPSGLDIDQWVSTAKSMGAKYAVLTSKHHSGFCLFPTATTNYGVASTAWYAGGGYDIVQQFATKFRAAGIVPMLYFSIWDRHFERSLVGAEFSSNAQCETYRAQYRSFLEAQIREILTRYGEIGGLWIDGGAWLFAGAPRNTNNAYPWDSYSQFSTFLRGISPKTLRIDNNHTYSADDSDIVEWELQTDVPQGNVLFGEKCITTLIDSSTSNPVWFDKSSGTTLRTVEYLLDRAARCRQRTASLLVNCPPSTAGVIPTNTAALAASIGSFLKAAPVAGVPVEIWLDPSDLSSMKQDLTGAAATTAAVVDSPVGSILNKGRLGGWITCADNASRPILRSSGGKYWLEFSGSQKFQGLNRGWGDSYVSTIMGIQRVSGNFTAAQDTSTPRSPDFQIYSNAINIGGATNLYTIAYTETGVDRVFSIAAAIATPTLRMNGVAQTLTQGSARARGSVLQFLLSPDGGSNGASRVYQYLSAFRPLSAADNAALEAFVATKSGVTF